MWRIHATLRVWIIFEPGFASSVFSLGRSGETGATPATRRPATRRGTGTASLYVRWAVPVGSPCACVFKTFLHHLYSPIPDTYHFLHLDQFRSAFIFSSPSISPHYPHNAPTNKRKNNAHLPSLRNVYHVFVAYITLSLLSVCLALEGHTDPEQTQPGHVTFASIVLTIDGASSCLSSIQM